VQSNSEFNHAEPGAEMSPGNSHRADRFVPQLICDLAQLTIAKLTKISRCLEGVQQGGRNSHYQNTFTPDVVKLMAQLQDFASLDAKTMPRQA
jgi:hypothetical protein